MKKTKTYLWLEKAGGFLMVAVALSLLINAIIVIVVGTDVLVYEVQQDTDTIQLINLSKVISNNYVSEEVHVLRQEKAALINYLGLACVLGYLGVHPNVPNNLKKLKKKLKTIIKD